MYAYENIDTNKVTPLFGDRSIPPQNIEAEEAILGGILMEGATALYRVKDVLDPRAFFDQTHREIYKCCLALDRENSPIDLMHVIESLKKKRGLFERIGGTGKLAMLVDQTVSAVNVDRYAQIVQEKFIRREAIAKANQVIDAAFNSSLPLVDLANRIKESFVPVTSSPLVTGKEQSLSLSRCDRLLAKINHIQLNIDSPTHKEFSLIQLAKQSGLNVQQLQTLFYKSLIEDEWEPTLTLGQLHDKYGDQVREWLLHGFIPKGATTLLHALGGQGKTRLIYDFIYHLALGEAWQGFPVTKKAKILIIQTDEQPVDMLAALEIRGIRPDDDRFDIHYKTRWSTEHIPQLYREVEQERYDLIMIDSLASISRFSTISENDAEFAKPILLLNKIAADFNAAIMLIHHSSKAGDARGTSAVYNAVSQVFQLKKPENDLNPASCDRLLLLQKSRARRPARYQLTYEPDNGSWKFDGEDTITPDVNSPTKEQIIEFLGDHLGIKFSNQDLAMLMNLSVNTVRRSLTELGADGIISWQKEGRSKIYWLDQFDVNVTKSQCDQPSDQGDQLSDQLGDQFAKPVSAWDRPPTDQLISKKREFSEKNISKNAKNADQLISSPVSQTEQAIPTDHPTDQFADQFDQVDQFADQFTGRSPEPVPPENNGQSSPPKIKKGDRVVIRDGCEINSDHEHPLVAGTVLEVIRIGKKGIFKNQLQVEKLGDKRYAPWVAIADVETMNICKEV